MYQKPTPQDYLNLARIRDRIGNLLKDHYRACTIDELPPRLLALLKKLDQELREQKTNSQLNGEARRIAAATIREKKGRQNSGLLVAHSEGRKHHGQGSDNRKCDD
jgi:hypothetical protein